MTTWSSTTPSIKSEIQRILDDGTFETGGDSEALLLPWANRIITEICNEMPIREHLVTSGTVTVTTAAFEYAMPTTAGSVFFKKHERFTKVYEGDNEIPIIGLEELNAMDSDHNETTTNTPVAVAIEGNRLFVYPMWAGDLLIKEYYRLPSDLVNTTDVPDIPVDNLRTDLIVAGVVGKYGFPTLNEHQKALMYYNRGTNPKSGLFFELLAQYHKYLNDTDRTWVNRTRFY